MAVALTLAMACGAKSAPPRADAIGVTLSLVDGEHSKDSNPQSYTVSVTADGVAYTGPHPPCVRGRCERGSVSFDVDDALHEKLVEAITDGDLMTSMSEQKKTGQTGNYVEVTLTLTRGGKSARTEVAGMTNAWSGGESNVLSKAARDRVAAVERLLRVFREVAESMLPQ
jgi:hypothetical protein